MHLITFEHQGKIHEIEYRTQSFSKPPKKLIPVDDNLTADKAYQLACEGTALLWQGDFQNSKQLLQALARRVDKSLPPLPATSTMKDRFHLHRKNQAHRARILHLLLIPVEAKNIVNLRRSPDLQQTLNEIYQPNDFPYCLSLKDLLGFIGAHEWRKKGVHIPELNDTLIPHFGVFSPLRGEYLKLIYEAPLPTTELAYDIGTGTGIISILLCKRGVQKVIATDNSESALRCAQENIIKYQLEDKVQLKNRNLFPEGKASLIVCNPPWLPAKPTSIIETALYDYEQKMLKTFLKEVPQHLEDTGEAWLIMSDLAVHLGLCEKGYLETLFQLNGLSLIERLDQKPFHQKASDPNDPLHQARSQEITSLYRLKKIK